MAGETVTCDGCGGTFRADEGTAIDGYAYKSFISSEGHKVFGGFRPLRVFWCHACFDTRDQRRARRALLIHALIGPVVFLVTYLICSATPLGQWLSLMMALILGVPVTLFGLLMYLGARPCTRQREGRACPTGMSMLRTRAEAIAGTRDGAGFMTREERRQLRDDPNVVHFS